MDQIVEHAIITPILKGKDIDRHRILNMIRSKDKYYVFYIADIEKQLKIKQGKIRKILKDLEKEKILIKKKSYPVFWKINTENFRDTGKYE